MSTIKNRAWLIWLLGALFFLMDYFIRISPSVITGQLMSSFHVGAFALGGLSAIFYYAYISMQLPVGVIFDRFGVRAPLIVAISTCTVGVFIFAVANNLTVLYFGRFLMGLAGAFSFVGALKLIHIFFPKNYFAFLAGATQALGMLGAAIGDAPMSYLMNTFGWRKITFAIGVLFILLLLNVIIYVHDKKSSPNALNIDSEKNNINVFKSLISVLRRSQTWINSLYIGFLYAPTAAFAGLWGVPYFTVYHQESTTLAAAQIGMIFIGLAVGCPIFGWFSNYTGKRLPIMRYSAIISFILITILIFGDHIYFLKNISSFPLFILLFFYGFFNSGIIPSYAVATEINHFHLSGMALGFTNMASLIIGALLLPVIGKILDHLWIGKTLNHHPIYSTHNYQLSLIILPICFVVALLTTLFIKETRCQYLQ